MIVGGPTVILAGPGQTEAQKTRAASLAGNVALREAPVSSTRGLVDHLTTQKSAMLSTIGTMASNSETY